MRVQCVPCGSLTCVGLHHAVLHRRGLKLDIADEEADNKYREPYFNFYDNRLMGVEWAKQPNIELTIEFFRLLALCHTVIPDGAHCVHKGSGHCSIQDHISHPSRTFASPKQQAFLHSCVCMYLLQRLCRGCRWEEPLLSATQQS